MCPTKQKARLVKPLKPYTHYEEVPSITTGNSVRSSASTVRQCQYVPILLYATAQGMGT